MSEEYVPKSRYPKLAVEPLLPDRARVLTNGVLFRIRWPDGSMTDPIDADSVKLKLVEFGFTDEAKSSVYDGRPWPCCGRAHRSPGLSCEEVLDVEDSL